MNKITLALCIAAIAITAQAQLNIRTITRTQDVATASIPDPAPLRWYQGESVTFTVDSTSGGAAFSALTNYANLVARWTVDDKPAGTSTWLYVTGTVAKAAGRTTFAASPAQTAFSNGTYGSKVTLYQTDGGTNTLYLGVLHSAVAFVSYRDGAPTYQGPYFVPADFQTADLLRTGMVDGTTIVYAGGVLSAIAAAAPDLTARADILAHTNRTDIHPVGALTNAAVFDPSGASAAVSNAAWAQGWRTTDSNAVVVAGSNVTVEVSTSGVVRTYTVSATAGGYLTNGAPVTGVWLIRGGTATYKGVGVAAFTNAAAEAVRGDSIVLGQGLYAVDAQWSVASGVSIYGSGMGRYDAANDVLATTGTVIRGDFRPVGQTDLTLDGLCFMSFAGGVDYAAGIGATNSTIPIRLTIRDVMVVAPNTTHGIEITGSDVRIDNLQAYHGSSPMVFKACNVIANNLTVDRCDAGQSLYIKADTAIGSCTNIILNNVSIKAHGTATGLILQCATNQAIRDVTVHGLVVEDATVAVWVYTVVSGTEISGVSFFGSRVTRSTSYGFLCWGETSISNVVFSGCVADNQTNGPGFYNVNFAANPYVYLYSCLGSTWGTFAYDPSVVRVDDVRYLAAMTNGSPLNATNIYGILPGGVLGTSVVRTVGGITTAGSITLTGSGSATVPLLQFGSTNTGFYTSSGNFVFVRAGNNVFTTYSTYFRLNKLLYMSVNGTGAAPAITFEDDTATGVWLPSAGSLGISASKTNMVTVTSRSVTISNLVAVGLSNIILPTSTNGLPTGALWNSNGVPAITP